MRTTWRWLGVKDGKFDAELAARDKEALEVIHDAQVAKYGKEVVGDFPNLTEFPVVLALVAERDAQIVDGCYFEAELEFCGIGTDELAFAALRREAPGIVKDLQKRQFRMLRTAIPKVVNGSPLVKAGFREQDDYNHYLLDIRS